MGLALRQTALWVSLTAGAAAAFACSAPEVWQGTIEERDGVVYVANPRFGLWQGRDPAPVRFVLEQTFGADLEPQEAILAAIGLHGVAVDGDGNVYVYDYGFAEIFSFAPNGTLRWRAGGPGQGPGEIFDAEGLAWDGDGSVYLSNAHLERLDEWSTAGEYIASHTLAGEDLPSGTLLGFLDPETAVVQGRLGSRRPGPQAGGVIGIIDLGTSPSSVVADIEIDVAGGRLEFSGISTSMVVSGDLVTAGDFDSYELRFFDRRGRLERIVSRDFAGMVGFPVDDERAPPFSSLSAPLRLTEGHWLALAQWVDVDDPAAHWRTRDPDADRAAYLAYLKRRSSLDLFDEQGRLLYSVESDDAPPEIGAPSHVGPDGKLYTRVWDPYPHVRRYRVEIERDSGG